MEFNFRLKFQKEDFIEDFSLNRDVLITILGAAKNALAILT